MRSLELEFYSNKSTFFATQILAHSFVFLKRYLENYINVRVCRLSYPFTYNCYFVFDSSGTKISPKNLPNPYGVKMREWGARIIVGKQHNWHLHKCMAH